MKKESDGNQQTPVVFNRHGIPQLAGATGNFRTIYNAGNGPGSDPNHTPQFSPADAWPFLFAMMSRWKWCLGIAGTFAAIGCIGGILVWKSTFTASSQIVRYESPTSHEVLGDQQVGMETFASVLRAPELVAEVAAKAQPPVSAEWLGEHLKVTPEHDSDVVTISIAGKTRESGVALANLYAEEAVRFTRERQAKSAGEVSQFLTKQLTPVENEIHTLDKSPELKPSKIDPAVARTRSLTDKLTQARADLAELLSHYTELHPAVREQRAKIAAIEAQIIAAANGVPEAKDNAQIVMPSTAAAVDSLGQQNQAFYIRSKLQSLESVRLTILEKQQAAETVQANPPGTCQVLTPATVKKVVPHRKVAKVMLLSGASGFLGLLCAMGLVLVSEALDDKLKTPQDVTRVTHLPLLASAGDLGGLNEAEQKNWAFRAWTSLQGRLSATPNTGLVCGITSSEHGEGRTTWVRLLAEAASQRGFRVLTIVAKPSPEANGNPEANGSADLDGAENTHSHFEGNPDAQPTSTALTTASILSTPAEVTQRLIGPNPQPVVQIPLPGWVWNLDRRKQWQAALQHWRKIDNIAIIVELPPASMPETVLLAENLPNLVWLADSGKASARPTIEQLETLRHAKCRLAGAVLNHAPVTPLTKYFSRWFGALVLTLALCSVPAMAQTMETEPPTNNAPAVFTSASASSMTELNTNLSFSVISPTQRAPWQQHLTLGPGDVLSMSLYGEPGLNRIEVIVGPDGRVSFAEAQDVMASGLTIDELRAKFDEELGKYRRAPQTMITPVAFRSKKYYMLGKVMLKGVYTLDRPITVVEAVARAHGFENGLVDRNIIDTADFSRSFLVRRGKRYNLDFEKLFEDGDLSQNIAIEPNDFLFFPSTNVKEVYVVGEVRLPGPVAYRPDLTVIGAIAARAGYTDRAYKSRVLVVRGSATHPQLIAVDTRAILEGKTTDFKLQPKDIIFVHWRPFIRVEELGDLAITAFLQSLVTSWVGVDVVKPFSQ
jgi:protein involved in polysaccharide export with SLBB domain/capsular polysaccharide biosynthesis protein